MATPDLTISARRGTPRSRRRPWGRSLADNVTGWLFVGPATVLVLGLSIFPAVWSLLISFQKWDGFSPAEPVGVANYAELLTDQHFFDSVVHTALYTLLFVPASVFAGLFLAVALNRRIRFIGFYRTAIFVPFVASAAATGILTSYLFNPQFGLVNNVLRVLGLPQQLWLESEQQAMVVIAIMSLWGQAAFTTVIYLAALQDVPGELLEAARLDGASPWQAFWNIVWPQLGPVTVFTTIWQTIGAIQLFDLVFTTTRGGPLEVTQTVVYYLYEKAFRSLEFGYGSAIAYVLFFFTLLITVVLVVYSRRRGSEVF
jgi:multiple sugar transport system permease protein